MGPDPGTALAREEDIDVASDSDPSPNADLRPGGRTGRAAVAADAGPRQAGGSVWRELSHHRCHAVELHPLRTAPHLRPHAVQVEVARVAPAVWLGFLAGGAWAIHRVDPSPAAHRVVVPGHGRRDLPEPVRV